MTRARWIAGVAVMAGSAFAAGSAEAAVLEPLAAAPAQGGVQRLLVLPGGSAAVVSGPSASFGDTAPGDVTVRRLGEGGAVRPRVVRQAWLVDAAAGPDGRVNLLVAQTAGRSARPRLSLWRVDAQGRLRRLWRTAPGAEGGVLARNGRRLGVAWIERPDPNSLSGVARMALGTDARGLRRSRVLTQAVGRVGEERFIGDLDLTLSAGGFPTVAAVRRARGRRDLVLARITPAGRVRERQLSPGVTGRVDLATTGTGRVAALLEDSGGEDLSRECGGGSGVRRIWAAVRATGQRRFGPLRPPPPPRPAAVRLLRVPGPAGGRAPRSGRRRLGNGRRERPADAADGARGPRRVGRRVRSTGSSGPECRAPNPRLRSSQGAAAVHDAAAPGPDHRRAVDAADPRSRRHLWARAAPGPVHGRRRRRARAACRLGRATEARRAALRTARSRGRKPHHEDASGPRCPGPSRRAG